jgi:sugar/nucleoside kinase (ribokinase family)
LCLDLCDSNLIDQIFDQLLPVFEKKIDILFANEDEANMLCKKIRDFKKLTEDSINPDPVLQYNLLLEYCHLAVVKRGKLGSLALTEGGLVFQQKAYDVENVCDTNGAGDNFQGGLLPFFFVCFVFAFFFFFLFLFFSFVFLFRKQSSGFFYGLFRGMDITTSLKIGNFIASKILHLPGANSKVKISGIEFLI